MKKAYEYLILNPSDSQGLPVFTALNALGYEGFKYSHTVLNSHVFIRETTQANFDQGIKDLIDQNEDLVKKTLQKAIKICAPKKESDDESSSV